MVAEMMIPGNKVRDFLARIREAAQNNLVSVIIYGSAAAGDFHPEYSDVNLFCVLRDSSFASLQALAPVVKWWDKQKQPPPLFLTREELDRSADVFSIELMDIQQHHKVVFGEDVIQELKIPAQFHRVQLEYELREKLSLLRRHLLLVSGNETKMWELLTRSVSSFVTLFRHALIAMGDQAPLGKRDAVQILANKLGFDAGGFLQVLDVRERKAQANTLKAADVFSRYMSAVEQVTAAVDRMLDSGVGSS